jgi:hypothetical protein
VITSEQKPISSSELLPEENKENTLVDHELQTEHQDFTQKYSAKSSNTFLTKKSDVLAEINNEG